MTKFEKVFNFIWFTGLFAVLGGLFNSIAALLSLFFPYVTIFVAIFTGIGIVTTIKGFKGKANESIQSSSD